MTWVGYFGVPTIYIFFLANFLLKRMEESGWLPKSPDMLQRLTYVGLTLGDLVGNIDVRGDFTCHPIV